MCNECEAGKIFKHKAKKKRYLNTSRFILILREEGTQQKRDLKLNIAAFIGIQNRRGNYYGFQ